ncbi:hypothetical protein [Ralstonia solanacearum]|uniref:hypothetical protein n=1 Tax=Ralstonia solanacearum TaxID=305 RepID=UPI000A9D3577|nr:hypothetical protein [Ralstonia solanacearum]
MNTKTFNFLTAALLLLAIICTQNASGSTHTPIPEDRTFAMVSPLPVDVPSGVIEIFYENSKDVRPKSALSLSIDSIEVARIFPAEVAKFHVAAGNRAIQVSVAGMTDDASGKKLPNITTVPVGNGMTVKLHIVSRTNQYVVEPITPIHGDIKFDKAYAYDSEDGAWVDVTPPPDNALLPSRIPDALVPHRTENWPVRAINISTQGVFEFDRQGNVLKAAGTVSTGTVLAQLWQESGPVWPKSSVYYLVPNQEKRIAADILDSPRGLILLNEKKVCPVAHIATGYRMLNDIATPILDGNCEKSVKRAIGKEIFWVYPVSARASEPELYWSVQYFDEPVRPMHDATGQCVLYCDPLSQKAAQQRSEGRRE